MPPIPISGPPRPYVRSPYSQDTRNLGSIYARQGDILAESARMRGATSNQFLASLAAAFQQMQAQEQAKQMRAQEMAMEQAALQRADRIRQEDITRGNEKEQRQIEREAAIYAAENAVPGPIDARRAEIIKKFPGTAARLRMTETLPATVTPGAMGEVSPTPESMAVLEPTPQQMQQAGDRQAQLERERVMEAARLRDDERMTAAQRETARHNAAMERAALVRQASEPEKPSVWLSNGAQTRFVTPTEAARLSTEGWKQPSGMNKPASGLEKRALNFFNRAQQADTDIEGLEQTVQGMNLGQQTYMEWAPNFMQSDLGQQYTQAQRAFTEARLRKDSGAAIPKEEYENDRKTYFAQPGDSMETLEQKRRGRAAVLASLGFESGQALGEFMGDAEQAKALVNEYRARSQKKADGGALLIPMRAPNGQVSNVPVDQVEHYKSRGAVVVK